MNPAVNRTILLLALAMPLVFAVAHFLFAAPVISHDTAIGWQTWRSMQAGAAWNHIQWPDPANLAQVTDGYLTWWTPGQYLPAGVLTRGGLTLGAAVNLVGLFGAWSLALGLWQLALALEATPRAAVIAALAASTTWQTLYAFGFFIGGEVALLAVWPWIVLGAWRTRQRPVWQLIALPLLFLIGSYAKLSFGIYALALLIFLGLEEWRAGSWRLSVAFRAGLRLAAAGAIYLVIWQWLHLGRGANPAAQAGEGGSLLRVIGFSLDGPWFSAVGFGSLLGRLSAADASTPPFWLQLLQLGLGLFGGLGAVALSCSRQVLLRLAGIVSLVASALLAALLLRGNSVSFEDRHFRPAGVLLLAAAGSLVAGIETRPLVRLSTMFALGFAGLFGVAAGVQRMANLRHQTVRADNDIAALNLDPASVRALAEFDQPGQLLALTDIMHLPLVTRARVLLDEPGTKARARWQGRVPHLVVMRAAGEPAAAWQARYPGYAPGEWRLVHDGRWQFWSVEPAGALHP